MLYVGLGKPSKLTWLCQISSTQFLYNERQGILEKIKNTPKTDIVISKPAEWYSYEIHDAEILKQERIVNRFF